MSSLNKFLSRFNQATIQRSVNYVQNIDLETLDIMTEGNTTIAYAQVEGTDYYDTTIHYHSLLDRLTETDCSCPVGNNCKHAAALARFFYTEHLHRTPLNSGQNSSPKEKQENNQLLREAQNWLTNFKKYLGEAQPSLNTAAAQQNHLIYILNQKMHSHKIELEVQKVRRNKKGEIRDANQYTSYDNILNQRLKLSESARAIFVQIYFYAKLNESLDHFNGHLDFSGMSLPQFKNIIDSGLVYWQQHQNPALQWTDERYDLESIWQNDIRPQMEKLELYIVDQQQRHIPLREATHLQIIQTDPLCYIDTEQQVIGQLNCTFPAKILDHLLTMPAMPVALLGTFDQIIKVLPDTITLPQPKSLQEMPVMTGQPIPILRFGSFALYEQRLHDPQYAFAEIEFEYPAGRITAGTTNQSFTGLYQANTVKQQRDLEQENKYIAQLKQMLPSFTWAKNIKQLPQAIFQQEALDNVIAVAVQDWMQCLLPENQFESQGWRVEHTAQSMFNLELGQNMQLSLEDSSYQQNWFEVGFSIQDAKGQKHDLIQLLSNIIQQTPQLLESKYIERLDEHHYFKIMLQPDQPQLAIPFREIKPVLLYLKDILEQPESRHIDRYDASQLLGLQHQLGMQWQGNQRLQGFADKLKQGYQQYLPTPQGFQGELRGYQQQGLAWLQFLRETEHGGILADDMGLGKTAQTLAHILLEKQAGRLQQPALIIAPTSLMQNWFKEARKFTPDLKVLIIHGPQRHALFEQISQYDIVLSTYPLLSRDEEYFLQHQYHLLILDEAQNIKNPRAKAAQVVRQLPATHRLCLTGTPMENHLGELWSLFYFLMPGFLYSQDIFNKKYRNPIEKQHNQQKRAKLVARIQPFMLRRLKTDVAKELPPKTTIEVNIEMNDQQAKLYEAVRATMQSNIRQIIAEKGFKRSQIQILDALLKLRQVCCHPSLLKLDSVDTQNAVSAKFEHLMTMVEEMLEEGRRILIFSQFTSMLQLIEDGLKQKNIPLVKLTGQTKKRDEVITAFQTEQVPVFLISLKAGGVGLNLTAADTVIHFDPWWNPAAEDQASDRAWRIGQDKPVFVYKLITNHSIEEKILDLQQHKAQLAQSILSHDQQDEVKLSDENVMQLFEQF